MTKPEITMEQVRTAIVNLGSDGAEVSNAELFEVFGFGEESDKVRLRRRMQDMVAAGEITRVREGIYTYNFKYCQASAKFHTAMWRFVRMQKPGWTIKELALYTRASYTHASKFCGWLLEEGYIAMTGKNGLNKLYSATNKAMMAPETPRPPKKIHDPFQKERAAAAIIIRLMLCSDMSSPKIKKAIVEACEVLLNRFKSTAENEN